MNFFNLGLFLVFIAVAFIALVTPAPVPADPDPDPVVPPKRMKPSTSCELRINELSTLYLGMRNRTPHVQDDKMFIELVWSNCDPRDPVSLNGYVIVLMDSRHLTSAKAVPIAYYDLRKTTMFLKPGAIVNTKTPATKQQTHDFYSLGFNSEGGPRVNLEAWKDNALINHLDEKEHLIFNNKQQLLFFSTSSNPLAKSAILPPELAQLPLFVLLLKMDADSNKAFKLHGFSNKIYDEVNKNTNKNPMRGSIEPNRYPAAWNTISEFLIDGLAIFRTGGTTVFPSPLLQVLAEKNPKRIEVLHTPVDVHGSMDFQPGTSISRCTDANGYESWRKTPQTLQQENECGSKNERVTRVVSKDAWGSPVSFIPENIRVADVVGDMDGDLEIIEPEPEDVVAACGSGSFMEDSMNMPPLEDPTVEFNMDDLAYGNAGPNQGGLSPSQQLEKQRYSEQSKAPSFADIVDLTCPAPAQSNPNSGACLAKGTVVGEVGINHFISLMRSTITQCLKEAGVDKVEEEVFEETSKETQAMLVRAHYFDPNNPDKSSLAILDYFDVPKTLKGALGKNKQYSFLKAYMHPQDRNKMVIECELDGTTWEFTSEEIALDAHDKNSLQRRVQTQISRHAKCAIHTAVFSKKLSEFGHSASKTVLAKRNPVPPPLNEATANMLATVYYETLADVPAYRHPLTTEFVHSLGANIGRIHRSKETSSNMRAFISQQMHSDLCNFMRANNIRFSLMLDSSTDTTGRQNLMVFVRFVHPTEHVPLVYYYGIVEMDQGETGETIQQAIVTMFDRDDGMLDHMSRYLIGLGSDGANVVAGMINGFAGRMIRYIDGFRANPAQGVPQIILHLKCGAHKLELCLKDAYSPKKYGKLNAEHFRWRDFLTRVINSIRSFYGTTAVKRVQGLKSAALLHNLPFLKLKEIISVRWASTEHSAIATIIKAYPSILVNLKEYVVANPNPSEKEKKLKLRAQVYIDILLSPQFYAYLSYEGSVLKCYSKFSKQLQSVSTNLLIMDELIGNFENCLDSHALNPFMEYKKREKTLNLEYPTPEEKALKQTITFAYDVRFRKKGSTEQFASLNTDAKKAFINSDLTTYEFGVLPPSSNDYAISDLLFKESSINNGGTDADGELDIPEAEDDGDEDDAAPPEVNKVTVGDDTDADLEEGGMEGGEGNKRKRRRRSGGKIPYTVDPVQLLTDVENEISDAKKSMDKGTYDDLRLLRQFKKAAFKPLTKQIRFDLAISMKIAVRDRFGEVPFAKFASFSAKTMLEDNADHVKNREWVSEKLNYPKQTVEREFQELKTSIQALPVSSRNTIYEDRLNMVAIHRALVKAGAQVVYGPTIRSLIETIMTLPISSSDVERGFSQLEYVFASRRKSMKLKTLDSILRIRINGPPFASFAKNKYANKWVLSRRRPSDYDSSNPDHSGFITAVTGEEALPDEPIITDTLNDRPPITIFD